MVHPPSIVRSIINGATWSIKPSNDNVYITFDDGPIPEVTPWVLDEADKFDAKLTFFCVGENVHKHVDIFNEIITRGHNVGNHTYNHIQAWKCSKKEYFENIEKASGIFSSNLFRPPHGQIYPWYMKELKNQFSRIVMWDILSCDFNSKLTSKQVYENVNRYLRPGSIIVFHDSIKAEKHMKYAFPKTLELILKNGLIPEKIN